MVLVEFRMASLTLCSFGLGSMVEIVYYCYVLQIM
jgi:hypothetical protein